MNNLLTFEEAQNLIKDDAELLMNVVTTSSLDFKMLRMKLKVEQNWTDEQCEEIENLYRKFLALNMRYPDKKICPTGPIDIIWHAHILDTIAYREDCNKLFGKFLDHYPYFGLRGPDDEKNLQKSFDETMELFIIHFGIDPSMGDTKVRSCRPQNCP